MRIKNILILLGIIFIILFLLLFFIFKRNQVLEQKRMEERTQQYKQCVLDAGEGSNKFPESEKGKKCVETYMDVVFPVLHGTSQFDWIRNINIFNYGR